MNSPSPTRSRAGPPRARTPTSSAVATTPTSASTSTAAAFTLVNSPQHAQSALRLLRPTMTPVSAASSMSSRGHRSTSVSGAVNAVPGFAALVGTIAPPSIPQQLQSESDGEPLWMEVADSVISLFNGEGLRMGVELLNQRVRSLLTVVPPTRLHARVVDILRQGMEVIRARTVLPTAATTDDRLPYRVMEVWAFFFGTVLPYVEGVFLPLQVELRSVGVSMRVLALATFRDGVILDIVDRLQVGFQRVLVDPVESRRAPDTIPRMLQMLTVLAELRDEQHGVVDAALRQLKETMRRYGREPIRSRSQIDLFAV